MTILYSIMSKQGNHKQELTETQTWSEKGSIKTMPKTRLGQRILSVLAHWDGSSSVARQEEPLCWELMDVMVTYNIP